MLRTEVNPVALTGWPLVKGVLYGEELRVGGREGGRAKEREGVCVLVESKKR